VAKLLRFRIQTFGGPTGSCFLIQIILAARVERVVLNGLTLIYHRLLEGDLSLFLIRKRLEFLTAIS
jgi:hypothetical protein